MSAQVPVTIITGFLGSGKTTLLNYLLQQPALADSAVIINEFGEIGIDHLLVAAPVENVVLLDTGCLCCTVRGDLVQTLADLYNKRITGNVPSFRNVIIETTGLADPVPLLQTVVTDAHLSQRYRLQKVVTLVDAVHAHSQLDNHSESLKQIAVADVVLVTKCDVQKPEVIRSLRERLHRLNPSVEIHEIANGAIDPEILLRGSVSDIGDDGALVGRWLNERAHAAIANEHEAARHDASISAFCVYRETPVRRAGLLLWLDMLASLRGAKLLRLKALLNVEGDPVVVHAVQTVIHEPVTLPAWPTEDHRSRFVFIGRGMDRAEIERTFDALDYAPLIAARQPIDPAAYAQFVNAIRGFR